MQVFETSWKPPALSDLSREMPPGGDKDGTHSNGHNSATVGPIELKLMFLKSSDTALHSDGQQNTNKHLECIEMNTNA